jgi:hypothetical protein
MCVWLLSNNLFIITFSWLDFHKFPNLLSILVIVIDKPSFRSSAFFPFGPSLPCCCRCPMESSIRAFFADGYSEFVVFLICLAKNKPVRLIRPACWCSLMSLFTRWKFALKLLMWFIYDDKFYKIARVKFVCNK